MSEQPEQTGTCEVCHRPCDTTSNNPRCGICTEAEPQSDSSERPEQASQDRERLRKEKAAQDAAREEHNQRTARQGIPEDHRRLTDEHMRQIQEMLRQADLQRSAEARRPRHGRDFTTTTHTVQTFTRNTTEEHWNKPQHRRRGETPPQAPEYGSPSPSRRDVTSPHPQHHDDSQD